MPTCAFVDCSEAETCALPGGCMRKKGRKRAPLGPSPKVEYNPMMGSWLDLVVIDEPEQVAAARWKAKRVAYLTELLAGDISEETRASYQRELARLTSD